MSARRLNDSEKLEIIELYRQSGETTISLADRFGVSNSTIGRVVKSGMASGEYDALVQQKRGRSPDVVEAASPAPPVEPPPVLQSVAPIASGKPKPRVILSKPVIAPVVAVAADFEDDLDDDDDFEPDGEPADPEYLALAAELVDVTVDEDDDDDFEDDEDFEDEDDDDFDGTGLPRLQMERDALRPAFGERLTVLPLADAAIPKVFYLVVDRGAELIAPPLRDFGELGEMSIDEAENRTLPMFDNHRVAKRFSNVRTQRVIKVPDNQLFYKTTRHLSAKGIKRFLLDGQVYTLV
jgi:hypothetical protein